LLSSRRSAVLALRPMQVRLRFAELAVQLILVAGHVHRADLLAVGEREVEVIRIVLLLADRLHRRAAVAVLVHRGDQLVRRAALAARVAAGRRAGVLREAVAILCIGIVAHTFRIEPSAG
jgi:hypothetical protein